MVQEITPVGYIYTLCHILYRYVLFIQNKLFIYLCVPAHVNRVYIYSNAIHPSVEVHSMCTHLMYIRCIHTAYQLQQARVSKRSPTLITVLVKYRVR